MSHARNIKSARPHLISLIIDEISAHELTKKKTIDHSLGAQNLWVFLTVDCLYF